MTYNPAMASVKYQRSQEALERALDELRNSEKKLRQVIDTIPTLAWSILPDGSNEFLNKRWHEYTGLSADESMDRVGKLLSTQRTESCCCRNGRACWHPVNQVKWKPVSVAMMEYFAGFS